MVHASDSLALAALELLVHLERGDLPKDFCAISAELPDDLAIAIVREDELPRNWRPYPAPVRLRAIGYEWLAAAETAALAVPSAVIPAERNLLLNPTHPDFGRISFGPGRLLRFDPSLASR